MSKLYIAKAIKGKEFLFSSNSAHAVSARSAARICDILNKCNYLLKPGETWHTYEYDENSSIAVIVETQRFTIRKGIITRHYFPV